MIQAQGLHSARFEQSHGVSAGGRDRGQLPHRHRNRKVPRGMIPTHPPPAARGSDRRLYRRRTSDSEPSPYAGSPRRSTGNGRPSKRDVGVQRFPIGLPLSHDWRARWCSPGSTRFGRRSCSDHPPARPLEAQASAAIRGVGEGLRCPPPSIRATLTERSRRRGFAKCLPALGRQIPADEIVAKGPKGHGGSGGAGQA